MSFIEIADQRLLSSVTAHVGELTWDVEADGYQRLRVPGDADVDALLRLLLRRGLDPALTSLLLDRYEGQPLERALIAWDVAAGSLLGPADAALAERVRASIGPVKELGTPAVAVHRDRIAALASAARGDGPLASAAALKADDTAGIDAAFELAGRLALAHLPSLAIAVYQILWERLALPKALDQIVEIALDYERFDSIPVMPDQDGRAILRQTYFGVRVALAQLDTQSAVRILAQMSEHPAVVVSSDPTLVVAKAELDLLSDQPILYGADDQIPATPTWRYASRVRDELRIHLAPENAVSWVDGFLTSFGNDMHVWAQAGYHADQRTALLALVSREVRYCPFDPEAWRALAVFLDDGSELELELQQRSAAQLAATLA